MNFILFMTSNVWEEGGLMQFDTTSWKMHLKRKSGGRAFYVLDVGDYKYAKENFSNFTTPSTPLPPKKFLNIFEIIFSYFRIATFS